MTVSFSKCLIDVFCSLAPVHRVNIRKGAQCRYASEVSYAGHIFFKEMSPTTHLRCVRVFALLKESLQVKKDPLNSALRKCIYKTLHLLG